MTLRFYNTYSNRVEDFEPLEPGKVRMYNCGPTVYAHQHLGNYRTYLFADVLRRYLEYRGYEVRQVINITDVGHLTQDDVEAGEDKVNKVARERGWDPYKVTAHFADAFFGERKILGFREPHVFARATGHIEEMTAMIGKLLASGHAYQVGGNVYFDVTKFPDYGKLSGNTLEKIRSGARIEVNPEKRHPADFALWKTDEKHLMQFDSPWGRGFPGWHIECSAMGMKHLGESFDIHTGGEDNIFPHHECEIAQSEATTGKPFVRYWMHARFLVFDAEKIAKSKGTKLTLHSFLDRGHDPMAIRYALTSMHYRQQVAFSPKLLEDAAKALARLREFKRRLQDLEQSGRGESDSAPSVVEKAKEAFTTAMDDDLNVSAGLSVLYDFARDMNRTIDEGGLGSRSARSALDALEGFDSVFAVLGETEEAAPPPEAEKLFAERIEARKQKDFARADELRDRIRALGWVVEDSKDGAKLKRA